MLTGPAAPDSERLMEQACHWLSKMYSGEFSTSEQKQLTAWRSADPSHEQAWLKAQILWQGLEGLRGQAIPGSEPLLPERNRRATKRISAFHRYRCPLLSLAVACSAVLATTLTVFYPPALWQSDYSTNKGEKRTISLDDGSRVTLNTASAIAIHFDNTVRRIDLLEGEAFFEVAKNDRQPFIVMSSGSQVKAIGTAFNVLHGTVQTKVELVEGVLELHDPENLRREQIYAGQTAEIGANNIEVRSGHHPDTMALWREGYLQFDSLPLQKAIMQINRYRPGKVLLLNKNLADKLISGLFRLDDLENSIANLKNAVPELQIVKITQYLVLLR